MAVHVFVFLLVFILMLSLARLWRLDRLHLQSSPSQAGRRRTLVHRLLRPRTPLDCPICRLSSSGVRPAPAPARPWCEVKSRRGAPKRVKTEGLACPNPQCAYSGITDAHVHTLVGDGKHGHGERIQPFRCQACRTTFTARRTTPLYRLKPPSPQIAMVRSALAEGLDPSAAERVFGSRQVTITTWLAREGSHAHTLHERCLRHLHRAHLQLDALRTRLRCATQVLWLWLVIDPCTKLLPVLHLGPRTPGAAHSLIHSLRHILAPGCIPLVTSDGLNLYFYAPLGPFWPLAHRKSSREDSAAVAGGGWSDLRPGEEMLTFGASWCASRT
jgi:transposase-like protein